MQPAVRDLFGEVPVSLADVLGWMLAVPGIPPTSSRFGPYVRDYRVIEKIRAAKLEGRFEAIVNAPPPPPPYRLAAAIDVAEAQGRRWRRRRRATWR